MAKMKVHELAKELDRQSKDILGFLQEKGIEAKAAQSSVEDSAADMVRKHFGGNSTKAAPAKEEAPKAEVPQTGEEPKKKKKIIFVSNPQNSKISGQRPQGTQNNSGYNQNRNNNQGNRSQGSYATNNYGQNGYNQNRGKEPARTPIKPLTPPSPTPSVQMVSSQPVRPVKPVTPTENPVKTTQNAQPVQSIQSTPNTQPAQSTQSVAQPAQNATPATQASQGQSRPAQNGYQGRTDSRQNGDRPAYNNSRPSGDRPAYNNSRPSGDRPAYNNNRPSGDRPAYNNNRPSGDRPAYNNNRPAGGSTYGSRPNGDRPAYNNNRPAGGSGYGNRPNGDRPAYNNNRPGGGSSYGNRDGRPGYGGKDSDRDNTRPGQGQFRKPAAKGFGSDGPVKDIEKHRDEEKRRISQEKDKRSKKDMIYDERDSDGKLKPGRFIKPEKKQEVVEEVIKVITLPDFITIKDLADKMKVQSSAIIKKLFLEGKIVTVNQEVSYEEAESIAMEYEILCEKEVKVDVIEELLKEEDEEEDNLTSRPPVICVMGHVDHGKTSLLDAIRKTNVTDREAGGITQHIGAYTVAIKEKKITFLDTPGHEAFTAMRMRGANATDIAILVVAADDGVMPQTIEAINHAKAAGIEIIVAVNKIDKPSANIDRVKQELTEYELIATDWGGTTEFVPVSAKSGDGIEDLLETIALTADILELTANADRQARGLVIEAELDKGRGPVATVLVQKGTLHVGDFISAGASHGKVRAMIDDKGRRLKEAGPSTPVEILGLSDVPSAGEVFIAHENDKTAKNYAETYMAQHKEQMLEDTKSRMSLDDLFSQIKEGNLKELNLIVKADVQGSVEAVKQSMSKLSNEEVVVKCIHGGVGAINESDVVLASASNAIIIGFNVRPDATAKATADREGVDVRLYKVIYQAIEDVQAAMKGMLDPIFEEKVIGHAEVRQIFKASAVGNIAGSYILDGMFQRGCQVRVSREGEQIFEGELASLKRFKDDVKEVKAGFECGLVFDGFDQIQELDVVEAYMMVEVPR